MSLYSTYHKTMIYFSDYIIPIESSHDQFMFRVQSPTVKTQEYSGFCLICNAFTEIDGPRYILKNCVDMSSL